MQRMLTTLCALVIQSTRLRITILDAPFSVTYFRFDRMSPTLLTLITIAAITVSNIANYEYNKDKKRKQSNRMQWRIQDFPEEGAPTPKSAIILPFFCQKLHENERI